MHIQSQILIFLEEIRNTTLTLFFTSVSIMSETLFIFIFLAVLYWLYDKTKARRIAWFVLFNGVCNGVIKGIINMPRPFQLGVVRPIRIETATGSSFPSGHTQTATAFWSGCYDVLRTRATKILAIIMVTLTAISRMYLGVHWPMDVIGAIIFGLIFTYFASQLINENSEFTSTHIIVISSMLLIVLMVNVHEDLYKIVASLWGFSLGSYLEQQYIQFEYVKKRRVQVVRLMIGLLGIVFIYVAMDKIFESIKLVEMIKYILICLWTTAGAPYIFKKYK